jgi:hypothetical protein
MKTKRDFPATYLIATLLAFFAGFASTGRGQLILNESNTVDEDKFLQVDFNEVQIVNPYEGYDYGSIPFSGNTNRPDGVDPGNPYPDDLDTGTAGNQTTLPNGWDGTTGWGRILSNAGDWFELVVTADHTDLRGYTLYWETDDPDAPGLPNNIVGETPGERGFIKFTQDKTWADFRAGSIITLSEEISVDEIRDDYPFDFPDAGQNDTGHDYDLSTDVSFDPFTGSDWHAHFRVDEDVTKDQNMATQYFEAQSDVKGHNRLWRMAIFNASNTTLAGVVENPAAQRTNPAGANYLDFNTGRVQDFIGEDGAGLSGFGASIPGGAGGVNGNEMVALVSDPATGITRAFYEDVDWSSFGAPNVYNDAQTGNPNLQDDTKLGGVQDFSALRNPVLNNTYDWTAAGTASFGDAANWQNADTAATPGTGPQSVWTARLTNNSGGSKLSQVVGRQVIQHGTVMATSGTMTLEIQASATLTVGGTTSPYDYNSNGKVDAADYTVWRNTLGSSLDLRADGNQSDTIDPGDYVEWKAHYGEAPPPPTGRLLVMDGGTVRVDGTLAAGVVEVFSGGTASGSGTIRDSLIASGGIIAPGNGAGKLTVQGNYVQSALSTLEIELGGTDAAQYDRLAVTGAAALLGTIDISLTGGFSPNSGNMFTFVTAGSLTANLSLSGDSQGFDLIVNPTSLILHYVGLSEGAGAPSGDGGVPEPATIVLVACAIAGLVVVRKRR